MRKKKNYVFVLDYAADPDLNHRTVERYVYDYLSHARGRTMKLGNCVMVSDPHDALHLKLHFGEHIVEMSDQLA